MLTETFEVRQDFGWDSVGEQDARNLLEVTERVKDQFRVNCYILGNYLGQRYGYSARVGQQAPQIALEFSQYALYAFSRLRVQCERRVEYWRAVTQDEALRQRQQEIDRRSRIDVVGLILEGESQWIYEPLGEDTQSKLASLVYAPNGSNEDWVLTSDPGLRRI